MCEEDSFLIVHHELCADLIYSDLITQVVGPYWPKIEPILLASSVHFLKSSPGSHRQVLHAGLVAGLTRTLFLCYSDGPSHPVSEAESPSGEQRFNQFMQKLGKKPDSKNLDLNNCALSAADVTEMGKYAFYSTRHFIYFFNSYLPVQLFALLLFFPFLLYQAWLYLTFHLVVPTFWEMLINELY